tara:strand:- start:447 stop:1526 length:1080 start_codon:yes stop_codon:yes gene_type:complete
MKNVIVGISGGVDSAVAAAILIEQGYNVEGLFMKNWEEEDSKYCTSEEDYKDALSVCDILNIPLRSVNFSENYWNNVFENFLNEYKIGRTPNPDILCNTEIKFKAFLDYAVELGAHKIATGHFAQIKKKKYSYYLEKGVDKEKDQSYFLYGLNQKQLSKAIFPLGEWVKTDVRKKAKELGFNNHKKKDSTGICFIGERHFREFLSRYISSAPGKIVTIDGETIGNHEGLMFYTIGQRKGLGIGGKKNAFEKPWYVIDKKVNENILIVGQDQKNPDLYHQYLSCSKLHWISDILPDEDTSIKAKIRYRTIDSVCTIKFCTNEKNIVFFEVPQFAITPGQSIVFYSKNICLGGGIIESRWN